jgi:hypothetical protein
MVLYDNQVESLWTDGSFSYSSRTPCDTTIYHSAPCSYAIAFQGWGAINFQYPSHDFSTGAYQSLDFYLQPNGQPLSDFGILLLDAAGRTITNYILSATDNLGVTANGFDHISVAMSVLNPANQPVHVIQIKNELNQNLATMHLDDVTLSG